MVHGEFIDDYKPFLGWTGFAIRGSFGVALHKLFCINPSLNCWKCDSAGGCFYFNFFEGISSIKPGMKATAEGFKAGITRPYVFTPLHTDGRRLSFLMNIFGGKALAYEPYIIMALIGMGYGGLGVDLSKNRRRQFKVLKINIVNNLTGGESPVFDQREGYLSYGGSQTKLDVNMRQVEEAAEILIKSSPKEIMLFFTSPTKIKYRKQEIMVPQLHQVIRNLARKYTAFCNYHGIGEPLTTSQAKEAINTAAKHAHLSHYLLREISLKKYSLEEGREKPLGTFFKGAYLYKADRSLFKDEAGPTLAKLLILGQYTHVGSFTTAGCGQYKLYLTPI